MFKSFTIKKFLKVRKHIQRTKNFCFGIKKTLMQRGILIIFGFCIVAYFYFVGSEAIGKLLFSNLEMAHQINHYLYLGLGISFFLAQKICNHYFPEKGFWSRLGDILLIKIDLWLNGNKEKIRIKDIEKFF